MSAEQAVRKTSEDPTQNSFSLPIPRENKPLDIHSFDRLMEQTGFRNANFIVVDDPNRGMTMHLFGEQVEHKAFFDTLGDNLHVVCGGIITTTPWNGRTLRWISGEASTLKHKLSPLSSNIYKMRVLKPRFSPYFRAAHY